MAMYSSVRMIDGNDLRQLRAAWQRPLSHIRCAPQCGAARNSNRTVARELKTISAFADVDRLDIALTQAIGNRSILSCGKRELSGRHVDIVRFLFSRQQPTIPALRPVELWLVLVLVVSHCLGSLT